MKNQDMKEFLKGQASQTLNNLIHVDISVKLNKNEVIITNHYVSVTFDLSMSKSELMARIYCAQVYACCYDIIQDLAKHEGGEV